MYRGFTLGRSPANMLHLKPFNFNYTVGTGTRFPWPLAECLRSFSARPALFPMPPPSADLRTALHRSAKRIAVSCPAELHHVLQLRPARLDEMFADRALFQTVRLGELPNGLPVFPRAPAEHS